ncbi:MAG: FMN-binding protein [Chloroflexota bacterium]
MHRRPIVTAASLVFAVLLLVNFRGPEDLALRVAMADAGAASSGRGPSLPGASAGGGSSLSGGSGSGTSSSRSDANATPSPVPAPSGTFTGPQVQNPFGLVQVAITVTAGKIVDVTALSLPAGGHSGRISDFVAPILRSQALAVQSARIDGVSGATYTSRAYAMSLQGALDAAAR